MHLPKGTRLGRYVVLERLATGGMGEIYRASDTRLDREVAIKRLPADQANNPTRRQRFEREAKIVSQLTHPNICAVFDVIDHEDAVYLVMELLTGQTLEERLRRGPLRDDELLEVAIQIADALAVAHRAGVVHRDTKPSNIMLTPGCAKLLDFGIAKIPEQVDPEANTLPGGGPPREASLTETGTTVGTLRYMSPEQLRGTEVGPPADVFALGMVLFEMAAGRPVYECDTGAEWIASVLREPTPDLGAIARTPLARRLTPLIETCCQKEPSQRLRDGGEVASRLRQIAAESKAEAATATVALPVSRARQPAPVWLLAVVLLLGVVLVGYLVTRNEPSGTEPVARSQPVKRFEINLPANLPLHPGGPSDTVLALSPDLENLVYVAYSNGRSHLVLRPLDQLDGRVLANTENGLSPFFSPDGSAIGFFTRPGSRLKTLDLETGSLRDLGAATLPLGGAWGPDDEIVYWSEFGRGLLRVDARGGRAQEITQLDPTNREQAHVTPSYVPDGSAVLFVALRNGLPAQLRILDLDTKQTRLLLEDVALLRPQVTSSQHLLWARLGGLSAALLDPSSNPVLPASDLEIADLAAAQEVPTRFDIGVDGSLLYVPASTRRPPQSRRLVHLDFEGNVEESPWPSAPFLHVRLSPNGRHLIANHDDLSALWLYSLGDPVPREIETGASLNFLPIWHPDGDSLVFSSNRDGIPNLYRLAIADGDTVGDPVRLAPSPHLQMADRFTADGRELLFLQRTTDSGSDLWTLPWDVAEATPSLVLGTRFDEGYSAPSPQGDLLAYVANTTGRYEIYLTRYPDFRGRLQVTENGAGSPVWSRDGKHLFYRSGNAMWRVEVSASPHLAVSEPQRMFEKHLYRNPVEVPQIQLMADGRSFLAIEDNAEPETSTRLLIVEGWLEGELATSFDR